VFARYVRENRVSLDDIKALISSMLAYDADEIKKLLRDKKDKPPIGAALIFKAIMADEKKGGIENLLKLIDRTYGKPVQKDIIEISDIPDNAKDRLNMILKNAHGNAGESAPAKAAARKTAGRKSKDAQ